MMYLIDDNQGDKRRKEMEIDFVDDNDFSGILTHYDKLTQGQDLSFLNAAACLLVHKTTQDWDGKSKFLKSTDNANKIIDDIAAKGDKIPLVIFSNGMPEKVDYNPDDFPNCIFQIKKTIFYSKLFEFVDHYKKTNQVELRILAFGKNYRAVEIRRYRTLIAQSLAVLAGNTIFKPTDIKPLSLLEKWHALSTIPVTYKDFCNNIEDNPMSITRFLEKVLEVENSIIKHGEYIYTWAE